MSKFTLKLEILGGSMIEDIIKEAKQKVIKYDLAYVQFNFNGTEFSIGQTANIKETLEKYMKKSDRETFIVSA